MKAKLVTCNVPSSDLARSQRFYAMLVGTDHGPFARSLNEAIESYHYPISADGILLTLTQRHRPDEPIVCYFAVDDLASALAQVKDAGGTVVVEALELPIAKNVLTDFHAEVSQNQPGAHTTDTIGRSALIRDPDGNVIGLVQLAPQTHHVFKFGRFRQPVDADQTRQQERAGRLGGRVARAHGGADAG